MISFGSRYSWLNGNPLSLASLGMIMHDHTPMVGSKSKPHQNPTENHHKKTGTASPAPAVDVESCWPPQRQRRPPGSPPAVESGKNPLVTSRTTWNFHLQESAGYIYIYIYHIIYIYILYIYYIIYILYIYIYNDIYVSPFIVRPCQIATPGNQRLYPKVGLGDLWTGNSWANSTPKMASLVGKILNFGGVNFFSR